MKKTLLASAVLLAFSASAMAAVSGQYQYGEGEALVVNEKTDGVKRLLGGSTSSVDFKTGSVTVNVGNWDYVFGGSYLTSATTGEQKIGFESTSVTINSTEDQKVTAMHVVGGTGGNDVNNASSDENTTRTASLTINGGEYGVESKWSGNTLENLIVGGDHFKNFPTGAAKDNVANVHLKSTTTTINDATVNSLVIGGSLANQYYAAVGSGVLETNVGTANTVIKNSTVNKAVVAGGVAMGINAISNVSEANLTIDSSTVNATVFAGGVVRYADTKGVIGAEVSKSTVTISNSTVQAVENGRGFAQHTGSNWNFISEEGKALYSVDNDTETQLNVTNSTIGAVNVSKGEVNLRAEGGNQTQITEALKVGADVAVSLTTDGATNDKYDGDIAKAIVIKGWDYGTAEEVKMEEGLIRGEITMGSDGKLVEKVNSVQTAAVDMTATVPLTMARILTNDVRKRLGDLRSAEGTHGVWARYDGGKLSGDDDFENKFHTIQVGIDTVPVADAPRFGVAFAYTKGESEFARGESDMDSFSLAFYGTKMYDNGMFADVIGRMATVENDMTVGAVSGKSDNVLLSLSGEIGWRFNFAEKFYVEPQAELTYTYVNSDKFRIGYADYETDSVNSLVGRVGFATGFKFPNNLGDMYVRASAVHEFLGDGEVVASNGVTPANSTKVDGEDTYVEFGIGANFNINKNTYVYADVEHTEGATLEEDWRANVGVRFAF